MTVELFLVMAAFAQLVFMIILGAALALLHLRVRQVLAVLGVGVEMANADQRASRQRQSLTHFVGPPSKLVVTETGELVGWEGSCSCGWAALLETGEEALDAIEAHKREMPAQRRRAG